MKRNNRGLLSCRGCGWKYTKLSKLPAYIKKTTIISSRLIDWLENKQTLLHEYFSSLSSHLYIYLFFIAFFFPSMEPVEISIHIMTKNKKKKIYTILYTTVKISNIFKKFINEILIHNVIKCRIGKLLVAPN